MDQQGMITGEVARCLEQSVLCWLATVDANGDPNVSPKEVFATLDTRRLLIANIASPQSVRNLTVHTQVCVSVLEIFVQKGFKLKGPAENIARDDPRYASFAAVLEPIAGSRFPIQSVIVVSVEKIEPILAPSYRFYPNEVTEASQIESAMRTYGVRPREGA